MCPAVERHIIMRRDNHDCKNLFDFKRQFFHSMQIRIRICTMCVEIQTYNHDVCRYFQFNKIIINLKVITELNEINTCSTNC